ncbi:MAG: hypothetical protein ABH803_02650 [Candidatus Micrarchaeota archaeon]
MKFYLLLFFSSVVAGVFLEPSELFQPNNGYSEISFFIPSAAGQYFFKADFHTKEANCGGPGSVCASLRCVNETVFVNDLQHASFMVCEPNPGRFCNINENWQTVDLTDFAGTNVSLKILSVGVNGCENGWGGWQRFLQLVFEPLPNSPPSAPVFNSLQGKVYGAKNISWLPSTDADEDELFYDLFFQSEWERVSCCRVEKNFSLLEDGLRVLKLRAFDSKNYSEESLLEVDVNSSFQPVYSLTQLSQTGVQVNWLLIVTGYGEGECVFDFIDFWVCDLFFPQEKTFSSSFEVSEGNWFTEHNFSKLLVSFSNPSFLNYSSLVWSECFDSRCVSKTFDLPAFSVIEVLFEFALIEREISVTPVFTPFPSVKETPTPIEEIIPSPLIVVSPSPNVKKTKVFLPENKEILEEKEETIDFSFLFVLPLFLAVFFLVKKKSKVLRFKKKKGMKLYCLLEKECKHNGTSIETILGLLVVFDADAVLHCSSSNIKEKFYSEKSLNDLTVLRLS